MTEPSAIVCRICGGDFVIPAGELLFPCPACGAPHHRPRATGNSLAELRRAHQQRVACDYVNAAANYQRVLNVHPDEAEALWGLTLCKYGVEYVRDERTGEHLPVIHFLGRKPFTEDPDCRLAIAKAEPDVRARYQKDAEYIARIQQEVLATEARGEGCDVFLCYKASVPGDPDAHTRELEHARDLYIALRDAGYKVFFAHTTLRHVAGANYEAQIFRALQSARVMLVITSTPEYLNTPWVHSEWSRYLERVDNHENCLLIPLLYDNCDPYDLPDAFIRRSLQGLSMGTLTALDDLRRIMDDHLGHAQTPMDTEEERLQLLISMALEDGEWDNAESLASQLIKADPRCAEAHLARLLAHMKLPNAAALATCPTPFDNNVNWKRACQFADPALLQQLQEYLAQANANWEAARAEEERAREEAQSREQAEKRQRYEELIRVAREQIASANWRTAHNIISNAVAYAEDGQAHLLRLLCELHLLNPESLVTCDAAFEDTVHWQNAIRLASPELSATLKSIAVRHAAHLEAKAVADQAAAQKAERVAAERQARRQREEAERARQAKARGSVTFVRSKELFRSNTPLTIVGPGIEPRQLLAGESVSFKVVDDCEYRIFAPDGAIWHTFQARADYIARIEIRWPLMSKPVFNVASNNPA